MPRLTSHHIAMRSPNYAQTLAFYTEVLGLPIVGRIPGRDVVFIDIGGTTIELVKVERAGAPARPTCGLVHLAFQVDDVDAAFRELASNGVAFHIEPHDFGDIRFAFFRDPDGNDLELFQSPTLKWNK